MARPASIAPSPLLPWAVAATLFAGTVLLFLPSAATGFLNYDDPAYVTDNLQVRAGLTWDGVVWAFTGHADYWHPLTWLSHMLDCELHGDNATGHHLTSIGWHAANAVLAFLVLRRLTGAFYASAFAAALFAWHPLRVESVVWITERKDVMSGFFFLLTLWAYAGYADRRKSGHPARGRYLLTLALFIAGLMCKPMLVTLPLLLLVLDWWPLQRLPDGPGLLPRWRGLVAEKAPFFALSVATAIVTVLMQHQVGAFVLDLSPVARLGNAVVSVARYLGNFFWPVDLSICYPHPGTWPLANVAGAVLLFGAVTAAAWWQRFARPWLLTGWLWFLVVLLPAAGLVQVGFQAMADRYTYLPILGWQLALVWTLREVPWWSRQRGVTTGVALLILAGIAARTWDQQAVWRDPATLFRHAVAVTERNSVAHAFLAHTLLDADQTPEAEHHSEQALAIDPHNETALFVLAGVRERQGRLPEAVAAYRSILAQRPTDAQSEFLLGALLLRQHETAEALSRMKAAAARRPEYTATSLRIAGAALEQAQPSVAAAYYEVYLSVRPDDATAHYAFGTALQTLGRTDEALESFRSAARLRPSAAEPHLDIGLILFRRGQPAKAAASFRAALALRPDLPAALLGVGRAAEQLGRTDEATASFEAAIAAAPDDAAARTTWAEVLARRRQFGPALVQYEYAVKLKPDDATAQAGLGFMLWLAGRHDEAVARWEEALRLKPDFPGLRERIQHSRR